MTKGIMIAGVGGQGTKLASRMLGFALESQGYKVKISEIHGMSQRGGSVVTYVRYGEEVFSPLIAEGEADFILSFEKLEAARYAHCLKEGGIIVTSTQEIRPMPVISGEAAYPGDILETLKEKGLHIEAVDALALAKAAGDSRTANVALIGRLSKFFGIPDEVWEKALEEAVRPAFWEVNKMAFILGKEN